MPKLIKDRAIIDDPYVFVVPAEDGALALPNGPVLVSLTTWQAHREALLAHVFDKGVQLKPDEFAEAIASDLPHLSMIAIEFPAFADGRGYSTAYTLRSRLKFTGELRAIGDVLKDTLFYQQRCGFNAFVVKADKDIEDALKGLDTFSAPYQGTANAPAPLFRRRLA
jgi:uncharacterized protein (DUF934 family)